MLILPETHPGEFKSKAILKISLGYPTILLKVLLGRIAALIFSCGA